MAIPQEIKDMLVETQLTTEDQILSFWTSPHYILPGWIGKTPQEAWDKGHKDIVIAFITILKSGDGSMT